MSTFNFDEHNRIDDLRIQQAIHGLSESQRQELLEALGSSDGSRNSGSLKSDSWKDNPKGDDPENATSSPGELDDHCELGEFSDFDECVALVDLWLTDDSGVTLTQEQRRRALEAFAPTVTRTNGSPDRRRFRESRIPATPPIGRWYLAALLATAAAFVVLTSMVWTGQDNGLRGPMIVSAQQMRQQMLSNPPEDMLQWAWKDTHEIDDDKVLGDVIWSDESQKGFARMQFDDPITDPALYQLMLYQDWNEEEHEQAGVLCCEFRFDGYSAPFVLVLNPLEEVSHPKRFSVRRLHSETDAVTGPNSSEEITLVAQAPEVDLAVMEQNGVPGGVVEEAKDVISNDAQTTTF